MDSIRNFCEVFKLETPLREGVKIVAGKRIGQVMLIQVVPNQREENVVALQLLVGQQSNYTGHVYTTQQRKKNEGLN